MLEEIVIEAGPPVASLVLVCVSHIICQCRRGLAQLNIDLYMINTHTHIYIYINNTHTHIYIYKQHTHTLHRVHTKKYELEYDQHFYYSRLIIDATCKSNSSSLTAKRPGQREAGAALGGHWCLCREPTSEDRRLLRLFEV